MMKPNKKAKWIVGITGTALSAFILSQLDANPTSSNQVNQQVSFQNEAPAENKAKVSNREQELANKDWGNFSVESNAKKQSTKQSTDSSTNQSTKQSTDTSTNQSVKQSADTSTNQSVKQSTGTSINQTTNPSINQPAAQPVNPPTDRNTSRS